eukprot:gene57398-biopygen9136
MRGSLRPLLTLGQQGPSRWQELCETVNLLVEIAVHFDHDGIDIYGAPMDSQFPFDQSLYFLNRPPVTGVRSKDDPRLRSSFTNPPRGTTPLTECIRDVAARVGGERPVLIVVATDGQGWKILQ